MKKKKYKFFNKVFFEDYLTTNHKYKTKNFTAMKIEYIYFSFFFSLIFIFSLKIIFISFQNSNYNEITSYKYNFNNIRNDILDRNGVLLSRNITAYHAAIKPCLIKDKNFSKIKIIFPEINSEYQKLNQKNIFI